MMRRALLLSVFVVFGVFVYFLVFRAVRITFLIPIIFILVALWYIASYAVTRGMIEKATGKKGFFFIRCSMVNGNDTNPGALTIAEGRVVFYLRKKAFGGVEKAWECGVSDIESYSLGSDRGITLNMADGKEIKFISKRFRESEREFRKALEEGR